MELKSRGGFIIGIGPENDPVFDVHLPVPDVGDASPLVNALPAQIRISCRIVAGQRSRQTAKSCQERDSEMIQHPSVDTHAHLDDGQFANDLESVVDEATASAVTRFINIAYSPERWQSTLALAARFPAVRYTLGLHPGHADEWSEGTLYQPV